MSSGLAISLFQDAAELVLWTVASSIEVNIGEKDGFTKMWEKVNNNNKPELFLPLKEKMLELNKARVGFKHYGILPDSSHSFRYYGYVTEFINNTVRNFFNLEFDAISLVDTVRNEEIRKYLKEAEELLGEKDLKKSLVSCEIAYQKIFKYVERIIPEISSKIEGFGERLHPVYERDDLRTEWHGLIEFLNNIRINILINLLGIKSSDFLRYKKLAPGVFIAMSGKVSSTFSGMEASENDVRFCIDFIINTAIEAQNRL